MSDMLDYLNWRGDILFSQLPLNIVDALIFSNLAYIHFDDIVSEDIHNRISLKDAAEAFLKLPDREDRVRVRNDIELLKAAAQSERFGSIGLSFYRNILIPEEETQFAAMTFFPEEGTAFLVFRGTDHTLVGWKEDFNMTFQEYVPAQHKALWYVREFAAADSSRMYLGGHSKGGNLAVYAAAKCEAFLQRRIIEVYNQDGPGFTEYMMGEKGYLDMVPKIRTYVPQSSVIGMLLEHEEPYTVIKSRQLGILQHDPYSWEIMGKDFITMEEITANSRFVDRTLKNWLASMSREERNAFADKVFELLGSGGASQTKDLLHPKNVRGYIRTLGMDDKMRRLLLSELRNLIESVKETQKNR